MIYSPFCRGWRWPRLLRGRRRHRRQEARRHGAHQGVQRCAGQEESRQRHSGGRPTFGRRSFGCYRSDNEVHPLLKQWMISDNRTHHLQTWCLMVPHSLRHRAKDHLYKCQRCHLIASQPLRQISSPIGPVSPLPLPVTGRARARGGPSGSGSASPGGPAARTTRRSSRECPRCCRRG